MRTIGRYTILRELGTGGFGTVLLAHDPELNRQVAIKIPVLGALLRRDFVERFAREGRSAAKLKHPVIVPVYNVEAVEGIPYLVSEYVAGETLHARLESSVYSAEDAARLVERLADALAHAHAEGIIHRDLKSANVMIDADGNPHLMDFGIAKDTSIDMTVTRSGAFLGTPSYMSPEQFGLNQSPIDHRTDIYSLGVVLYETLTGELPFHETKPSLVFQRQWQDPPRPGKLRQGIPREMESVCLKCLELSPDHRYATAADLRDDLRRFLAGEPVSARNAARLACWVRRIRRHTVPIGAALLALVLVTLGFTAYYSQMKRLNEVLDSTRNQVLQSQATALSHEHDARQKQYVGDIQQAERAWTAGDLIQMRSLLDRQIPEKGREDLRGFEWHHLNRRCRPIPDQTIQGHTGRVFSVCWSPDGSIFASAGEDGRIAVHRADGSNVWRKTVSNLPLEAVVFAADGHRVIGAGEDQRITVLNAATGEIEAQFPAHDTTINTLAVSPDGRKLVSGCYSGEIAVWELPDNRLIRRDIGLSKGGISAVAISHDGRMLAAGCTFGLMRVADLESGKLLWEFQHPGAIKQIAFARELPFLATACQDNYVRQFTLGKDPFSTVLGGFGDAVGSVSYSRDDNLLAAADKHGKIQVWDTESQTLRFVLRGQAGRVFSVSFSPTEDRLLTGDVDGRTCLWDLQQSDRTVMIERVSGSSAVSFHPSGDSLAAMFDKRIYLASLSRLYSTAASMKEQDAEGRTRTRLTLKRLSQSMSSAINVSQDSKWIALATQVNGIEIIDAASGQVSMTLKSRNDGVRINGLEFSPNGKLIVATTMDSTVHVWELRKPDSERVFVIPSAGNLRAGVALNCQSLLCVGDVGRAAVIDLGSGSIFHLSTGVQSSFKCMATASGGEWFAAGTGDGSVVIWNGDPLRHERTIYPLDGEISDLAISADGQTLAIAGSDNRIRLWATSIWQEVLVIPSRRVRARRLAFSPDGQILALVLDAGHQRTARGFLSEIEFLFGRSAPQK